MPVEQSDLETIMMLVLDLKSQGQDRLHQFPLRTYPVAQFAFLMKQCRMTENLEGAGEMLLLRCE